MMRFARLLEVSLLHDYCLNLGNVLHEALENGLRTNTTDHYSIHNLLDIQPTAETIKTMAGYQMLFKKNALGFFIGIKLDDSALNNQPAIPLTDHLKLRFLLKIKQPGFLNYTALPAAAPRFYRFGNDSGNASADALFLSLPVAPFNASRIYEANEIYASAADSTFDLFRAIRDTGPAATPIDEDWEQIPAATLDPAHTYSVGDIVLSNNRLLRALINDPGVDPANWEILEILPNQYVTREDSLLLRPGRFDLDISAIGSPRATVRVYSPNETPPVWQQFYSAENGSLSLLSLDLHTLSPGRYRLELLDSELTVMSDQGFEFYLDSQGVNEGWFGVIEIVNGSGSHRLLDVDNSLLSPLFQIRFLNRTSRWRYIFPQDQPVGTGAEVEPESGNQRILITADTRPLTLFGRGVRLQADLAETPEVSEEVILPRPEINRIRYQDAQWFSETYMSNLPL